MKLLVTDCHSQYSFVLWLLLFCLHCGWRTFHPKFCVHFKMCFWWKFATFILLVFCCTGPTSSDLNVKGTLNNTSAQQNTITQTKPQHWTVTACQCSQWCSVLKSVMVLNRLMIGYKDVQNLLLKFDELLKHTVYSGYG